jgi:Flp pilus assembly protein TadG
MHTMSKTSSYPRLGLNARGVALIEFAIILPLLLLIFTGLIEYGRMMWHYDALAKATRDAARHLSMIKRESLNDEATSNNSILRRIIIVAAANSGLNTAGLQINPSCAPSCTGTEVSTVKVEVISPFTIGGWVPVFGAAIGPEVKLSPHTTMPHMGKT